jgi:5-methylcytosine-specific restriction endonuclease McrA
VRRKQACLCGAWGCQRHLPAWGWANKRNRAARDRNYVSATYRRNRGIALAREPRCHWQYAGCTGRSTQADHLVPVSQGGDNSLANLVGSCRHCNEARGRAAGNAAKRRR